MSKSTRKICFASIICVLLCALTVLPAFANSAQSYWEGVSTTGVLTTDGECPLVVEHETLTFDIAEFPSPYTYNESYNASVTAEYTFYNPSDMTVTANLLFPFGIDPYYTEYYDAEKGEYVNPDQTEKYGAQVNGAAVQTTVRHSYWGGSLYNFDPVLEMAKLQDSYRTDSFLTYELPVHVYTYRVEGVDHQAYRAADVATYIGDLPEDTRVMLQNATRWFSGDEGGWLGTSASYSEIVFYVFGKDIGEVQWTVFENGALEKEIEGSVKLIDKQSTTFGTLAMQHYDPASGVAAHDWFNAVVAQLEGSARLEGGLYSSMYANWDVSKDLLQWYEYKITLAPGERLTNTVKAPLYPNIDGDFEPPVYSYEYFLTPASLWKEFGTLDIYINTPHVMVKERKGEFSIAPDQWSKTDAGYELHLEGLPAEDLVFTLSTVEDPERVTTAWTWLVVIVIVIVVIAGLSGVIAVLILILCVLIPLVPIVIIGILITICLIALIISAVRKHKAKKQDPPSDRTTQ